MINRIIGTVGSRLLNAIGMVLLLLLISRNLKSEGLGLWQLIVLNVAVFLLVAELFTGSVLSFFSSRKPLSHILLIAFIWLIFCTLLFIGLRYFLHIIPQIENYVIPQQYFYYVILLSFLTAILQINYNILVGKEKIKEYNFVFMLHIILVVVLIAFSFLILKHKTIYAFFYSEYIAISVSCILGFYYIKPDIKFIGTIHYKSLLKQMFSYSSYGQLSNFITLINKRLSYFYLNGMLGLSSLGVYSGGVQLTESLKVMGSSIATVQYSRIANSRDMDYAKTLTIQLLKLSLIITLFGLIVLIVIPSSWYVFIFGEHFSNVKPIIYCLSPGILALIGSMIFSHFFSGIGLIKYNMWAALTGMIVTFSLLFILIRLYGNIGAAITASFAHFTTFSYHLIVFVIKTKPKFSEFILKKDDFKTLFFELKKIFVPLH